MFFTLEVSKVGLWWLSPCTPPKPLQDQSAHSPATSNITCRWLPAEHPPPPHTAPKDIVALEVMAPFQEATQPNNGLMRRYQRPVPLLQSVKSHLSSRFPHEVSWALVANVLEFKFSGKLPLLPPQGLVQIAFTNKLTVHMWSGEANSAWDFGVRSLTSQWP